MLGYKNERCAQDSYHRFRREHFPRDQFSSGGDRRIRGKPLAAAGGKKQYYADGRAIARAGGSSSSLYRDDEDEEGLYDTTNDEDDDDREEDPAARARVVVKIEDHHPSMEKAEEDFWSLGFINLEEEWEDFGEKEKVKIKPEVKKERVVEKWVWT